MLFVNPRVGAGVDGGRKTVAQSFSAPPQKKAVVQASNNHMFNQIHKYSSVGLAIVVDRVGGSWQFFVVGPPNAPDQKRAWVIA